MAISLSRRFRPSLAFVLLCAFLTLLWVAGGASRADAGGQIIVRGGATLALILMILFGPRMALGHAKPVWFFLAAAFLLVGLQLVPLPPDIWQAMPGRATFVDAIMDTRQQPWRPLAIVPGATANAIASLIVPLVILLLTTSVRADERPYIINIVLMLVIASTFLGLLQFTGVGFNNPFVNDTPGVTSSSFANRNHFALFLALGCVLTPVWALNSKNRSRWRGLAAIGLLLLLLLVILGTGSRAGMGLGLLASAVGAVLVRKKFQQELSGAPRWVFPAVVATILIVFVSFFFISIAADRAISMQRAFDLDTEQDMRTRAFPILLEMIQIYFPFGTGIGSFDPIFRLHEPFNMLKLTYFNHAHNDLLEVVLESGLPGILLLLSALAWWGMASVRAWRARDRKENVLPKLGSSMLLLVFLASAFDYPGRTPMMMAIIIIASVWLSSSRPLSGSNAKH